MLITTLGRDFFVSVLGVVGTGQDEAWLLDHSPYSPSPHPHLVLYIEDNRRRWFKVNSIDYMDGWMDGRTNCIHIHAHTWIPPNLASPGLNSWLEYDRRNGNRMDRWHMEI